MSVKRDCEYLLLALSISLKFPLLFCAMCVYIHGVCGLGVHAMLYGEVSGNLYGIRSLLPPFCGIQNPAETTRLVQ